MSDTGDAARGADAASGIAASLRARSGFAGEAVSLERVASYLAMRAREIGAADPTAAAARILGDSREYARLESHFAPPETWLFRYAESFECLRSFARGCAERGVRALVVGAGGWCEPCSVAAALLDGIGEAHADAVVVEAVDRNGAVFARTQAFRGMDCRAALPAFASRFFPRDGDALRPSEALLRTISTREESAESCLAACERAGARFDVILFRNVAIYLEESRRNALFAACARLLVDDGVLLVGHAEVSIAAAASGLVASTAAGAFALVRARAEDAALRHAPALAPSAAPAAGTSVSKEHSRVDETTDPSDAASRARAAVAARPTDPSVHVAFACILEASGDAAGARESVGRALYLDRGHEDALVLAARLAAARGEHAEADHLRERAMRAHLARMRAEGGA